MGVGATTLRIGPLAVLARGVAFVVPVAVARVYGAGPHTDAFFWALALPTFVYAVAGAVTGAATLPSLARLQREAPASVAGFVSGALLVAGGVSMLAALVGAVAAPGTALHTTRFADDVAAEAALHVAVLAPLTVGVAVLSVLRAAVEAEGAFATSVGAPLARGAVTLGGVLLAGKLDAMGLGQVSLPLAYVFGVLAEVTVLAAAWRRGGHRLAWPDVQARSALREAGRSVLPLVAAEALLACGPAVDRTLAARVGGGAVSALEYADRARLVPRTLLDGTLVAVALRAWAKARAEGDLDGQREAVATSLWWVLLLAPPMLAGMSIGRIVLVDLLYGGGTMQEDARLATAQALDGYLPGVLAGLLGMLLARAWAVEGRSRALVAVAAATLVTNVLVGTVLHARLGVAGVALGASAGHAVHALIAALGLRHALRGTLPLRAWRDAGLVVGVSLGCALAARWLPAPSNVLDPTLLGFAVVLVATLLRGATWARRGPRDPTGGLTSRTAPS